jgi:hypothetical protein
MMGTYFLAVPSLQTHGLAHFKVSYDVYVYTKQLEHKLNVAEEEIKRLESLNDTLAELLNEAGIHEY